MERLFASPLLETYEAAEQASIRAPESAPLHTLFSRKAVISRMEGLPNSSSGWSAFLRQAGRGFRTVSQCHLRCSAQYLNVQTQHTRFHTYASFVQPYLIQTH